MNYLFILCFWIGILLLVFRDEIKFKKSKSILVNYVKEKRKTSKTYNSYLKYRKKKTGEKLTKELSESLAYVNNLMILGREKGVSVENLLSELSDYSDKLRPAFLEMAHYLNMCEKDRAANCLGKLIGTQSAYDVGRFLAGWDDIPPEDIAESLSMYRENIRAELDTKERSKNELISDLVYFPVVANCMIVLLNFVYVAYFIEQKEALSILF